MSRPIRPSVAVSSARCLPLVVGALLLPAAEPASAVILTWRAAGEVSSLIGDPSLLPLPAAVGDAFVIDFEYDSETPDASTFPTSGSYALIGMTVTVGASKLEFSGPGGNGRVAIQTDPAPNLWGVSACLPSCSNVDDFDEARMNLFLPASTLDSDALVLPPDPASASVQFGLFSNGSGASEAFLVASLDSLTLVPLPAAGWLLGSGIIGLLAVRRQRAA